MDIKKYIDGDGDGEYDNASIIIDTDGTATAYLYDENGNIIDQQVINSNSFPNDDIIPEPSPDNEPYIINSTVVSEDGHNGLANYYSDGSVEIKLDIDGDGLYNDGRVFMSAEGEISYYDADDNLITTPEYPEYDFTNIDSNNDIADNSNFGDDFNNNIDTNDWSSPV